MNAFEQHETSALRNGLFTRPWLLWLREQRELSAQLHLVRRANFLCGKCVRASLGIPRSGQFPSINNSIIRHGKEQLIN